MRSLRMIGLIAAASLLTTGCEQGGEAPAEEPAAPAESMPLVLVAGATGKTGSLVVAELQAQGYAVRAFVRSTAKAAERLGPDVEAVQGDLRDPDSIAAAMDGVGAVINAAGAGGNSDDENNTPERVDFEGARNLAEAAAAVGVEQYVLVSSRGATHDDHVLNRMFNNVLIWKRRGEEAVAASGVPYTIVRPGGLADDPGGNQAIIFEQGDTRLENIWINRADVARVCVAALANEDARNKVFEIHAEDGEPQSDFAAEFASLSGA